MILVAELSRRPPPDVKRQLRREVGFGCPVRDCGIPYLTWHHFDPPWRDEHHHRPEGMIALCTQHAAHADDGLYAYEYLRSLKADAPKYAPSVRGQLEWMQRKLLVVIGGIMYLELQTILQIGTVKAIWFGRDEDGYLLLNVRMPTVSGMSRIGIRDNFLTVDRNQLEDMECTARGRKLKISYQNGDLCSIEFFELLNKDALVKRYGERTPDIAEGDVEFPVTGVEVWERAAGSGIEFGPSVTRLGTNSFTGSGRMPLMSGGGVAIHIDCSTEELRRLFPKMFFLNT